MSELTMLQPLEIKKPQYGFTGYMLRCKAISEEDCSQSILVREPGNPNFIHEYLPASLNERLEIRKSWYHECEKHSRFVCINVDMSDDMDFDTYQAGFPVDIDDVKELTENICKQCKEYLSSYDIFAVVIHKGQLNQKGDEIFVRPYHYHVLMSCDKRRTKEEIDSIIVSDY